MSIAAFALIVSASSFFVSVGGFVVARRNSRISELNLLGNLQREWAGLKPSWHRAILTVYGASGFYSPAGKELRQEYAEMIEDLKIANPGSGGDRALLWPWIHAIQNVIEFMGTVSTYVLTGQLTPEHAYTIFGPEVARRSRPVRVLLGLDDNSYWDAGSVSSTVRSSLSAGQYTGRTERVLCLLDILWAQAALLQDMYNHDLKIAAKVKQEYGSGFGNRKRIARICRQIGGSRITSVKLQWHLTNSEVVEEFAAVDSVVHRKNELANYPMDANLKASKPRRFKLLLAGVIRASQPS